MTRLTGSLAAGLPLVALTALLTWQAQRLPLQGQPLQSDTSSLECTTRARFDLGFPTTTPPQPLPDQAYSFMGNAWLTTDVCTPGTLRLTAEGQEAGGEAPRLEVALNSRVIWEGEFTQRREVSIPVPSAGHLTLGYFNDYYRSEYRSALLQELKFEAPVCRTFQVSVPEDAGGVWDPGSRSVGWLFAPPITLKPCGAGTLSLRASGQAGGEAFATLAFTQGGHELLRARLGGQPRNLTLDVGATPVQVRIVNPYFKELGDRNLYLRTLKFVPER
ncbi:hypothetical protein GCM10008955_18620 [Deinococcus malanensis]|uniref:Uncharacterized protein n=1 Tax=Deinococcus malanensis TaxID=1706855 RepID=A0ABQ2EX76_9DEIO|nr:hypothetical protein [Deinococcus malanensis]GGK25229.1 hypothetical protein GCM10008955_18620 [Deinococcus malanensis]